MEPIKLPDGFWNTGPLCRMHGGSSSGFECKACKLGLPDRMVLELKAVWVPFEVNIWNNLSNKCPDLPRFASGEEVKDFIQFNSQALSRRRLQWVEHSETWAIEEFIKGVGRSLKWRYGPPLRPDEPPISTKPYIPKSRL